MSVAHGGATQFESDGGRTLEIGFFVDGRAAEAHKTNNCRGQLCPVSRANNCWRARKSRRTVSGCKAEERKMGNDGVTATFFFPSSLAPPSPLIRPVPRERRSRSATEPCMRPIRRPHLLMGEGDAGLPVAAGESGDSPTGPQSHLFRCFPSACEIPGAILPRGCGRIAGWSVCSLGIHHHPAPCRSAASLIGPRCDASR